MPSNAQDVRQSAASTLLLRLAFVLLSGCMAFAPWFQLRLISHIDKGVWTDLYAPWVGTKAALHRENPYSEAVTGEIETTIYGHVLQPNESWDRQSFVYPLYIVFLLAPLTLLPWTTVHFLLGLLAPVAVAVTVWTWMLVCRQKQERRKTVLLFVLILCSWPAVWGYFQRQPSLYVGAAMALGVLLFQRRRDTAAGILLGVATVKPQLAVLLAAWLLLQAYRQRRWRFIGGFGGTLVLLVGGSLALQPGWIPEWLQAGAAYTHKPPKVPLLFFFLGRHGGVAASVALAAALLVTLWRAGVVRADSNEFGRAVAAILAATVCLMPENAWLVFNVLLMIPAWFYVFRQPVEGALAGVTQILAACTLLIALISTPVCAALGLGLGFSLNLVMPPFLLNYFAPIPLTLALFSTRSAYFLPKNQRPLATAALSR